LEKITTSRALTVDLTKEAGLDADADAKAAKAMNAAAAAAIPNLRTVDIVFRRHPEPPDR
jgi:hypothetical protein